MIYGSGLRVDGKWVHGKLLDGSKVTVTHGNLEKPIVVVVEDGVPMVLRIHNSCAWDINAR